MLTDTQKHSHTHTHQPTNTLTHTHTHTHTHTPPHQHTHMDTLPHTHTQGHTDTRDTHTWIHTLWLVNGLPWLPTGSEQETAAQPDKTPSVTGNSTLFQITCTCHGGFIYLSSVICVFLGSLPTTPVIKHPPVGDDSFLWRGERRLCESPQNTDPMARVHLVPAPPRTQTLWPEST